MATANYNLPTISGEEVIDIVGDMNALANATDAALKKVEQGGLDPYALPTATRTVKGGVIVGDGLSITPGGVLSTVSQGGGGGTATLPVATSVTLGGVKIGAGITVTPDGTISVPASSGVADGAVTSAKIASGAVTSDKLATSAVTTNKIDTGAVTSEKIADGSISSSKLDVSTQEAVAKANDAITVTAAAQWTSQNLYNTGGLTTALAYNSSLNLAYVKVYLDNYSPTSTRVSIGTVPAGKRPGRNQYQLIWHDTSAGCVRVEVSTSGAVTLQTDGTGGALYGGASIMYPIGM